MSDLGKMTVQHDDSPDDEYIEVYVGDENPIPESELEKIAKGKGDGFAKSGDKIRQLDGLSPNLKRKITRRINKAAKGDGDAESKAVQEKTITGYAMFDVVEPPYNLDYLAKLYEISSAHKAAVDAKVTNIVGLGFEWVESLRTQEKLQNLDGQEERLERARRKIARGRRQMYEWLDQTNNEDVFPETLRKVWTDVETTGNGYFEVGRKANGQIGYIGHLHATTIRRRVNKDGYVQMVGREVRYFRNYGTDTSDPITGESNPNEIIHIAKYTPTNSYYGVPDVLAARNEVAGNEFAQRFNLDYFEHKAVPRYVITLKGGRLSRTAEQKLVSFLSTNLKGQHHRTLFIPLPPGTKDNPVEFNMEAIEVKIQDASFAKYHEMNRDGILMAHRTPLPQTGAVTNISLGASRDSARMFKEQVCRPWQEIVEFKLAPVFREVTDAFEFKLTELSLTDAETQSKIDERYLRWEVFVPNDVLERLGMKGRKGGDDPVGVVSQAQMKEQRAQANRSRTRDQDRASGPDKDVNSNETREPKGSGSSE